MSVHNREDGFTSGIRWEHDDSNSQESAQRARLPADDLGRTGDCPRQRALDRLTKPRPSCELVAKRHLTKGTTPAAAQPRIRLGRSTLAARNCVVIVKGIEHRIDGVSAYATADGLRAFGPFKSRVLRVLRRKDFRLLHVQSPHAPNPA